MSKNTDIIYLVASRDRYRSVLIRRMAKSRPFLEPDEIAVKVKATIPDEAFAAIEHQLDVDPSRVTTVNLETESEPDEEAPA